MPIGTKNVFILGSSGFIGKSLFDKFSKAGKAGVIGFSSKELNLLSREKIKDKLSGLTQDDVLIIAAAITRLEENSYDSMIKNIQMADNIADFISAHPAAQVIYLSTIDVYGIDIEKGVRIREDTPLCPNDYYAISKVAGEFLLRRICGSKNIPLTILRLCGIYGAGDAGKSTINAIISAALRDRKISIYGDGKDLRDYVYVEDIYEIIRYAADRRLDITVNVATGESRTITAIAHLVRSLMPDRVDIEFRPARIEKTARRVKDLVFDSSYFKKAFAGLKLTGIEKGVSAYIKDVLKEHKILQRS